MEDYSLTSEYPGAMAGFLIRCVQYEKRGKSGCCLSPVLFTVYIDGVFQRLQFSGVGRHIGGVFAGDFEYADDIVLLSPPVNALRHMICTSYDLYL